MHSLQRTSTLALRQRKAHLLRSFKLPADLLHASLIERFLKCGKPTCHCHTGGPKHGPFSYLNRCFGKGQLQSLLLILQTGNIVILSNVWKFHVNRLASSFLSSPCPLFIRSRIDVFMAVKSA
jgi:hypothetical protein